MASNMQRALDKIAEIERIASRIAQETAESMAKDAVKYAVRAEKPALESLLTSEYKRAAAQWYAAYVPKKYLRKHSIYNLMSMSDDSGFDIGWKFSDDAMTKSSNGGSLFDPVFMGGSHGLRHRSFIPTVTTAVPKLFDDSMKAQSGSIASILQPAVQEYYSTNFQAEFEPRLRGSIG